MAGLLDWLLDRSGSFDGRFGGVPPAIAARGAVGTDGVPLADANAPVNDPYGGVMGVPDDPFAADDAKRAADAARKAKDLQPQVPIPFAGMLNGGSGLMGAPGSGPMPDLPPSTNDPTAREPDVFQNGVPLPRPKPSDGLNGQPLAQGAAEQAPMSLAPQDTANLPASPDSAALPPGATPTGPAPGAGSAAAPAAAAPSFLSRLGAGISTQLNNNPSTLLALGAGFSGAGSLGTGMRRAFSAAAPAAQADRALQIQTSTRAMTYQALVQHGMAPADALAASMNPEIMKQVATTQFGTKYEAKTVKDMMGNETPVSYDARTGKYLNADGSPYDAATSSAAGMGAAGKLPPNYDPATGRDEAFLSALDPTTQAAVKGIVNGQVPASGRNMQKLLPLAARYENGFTAQDYQTRLSTQRGFDSGAEAKQVKAVNQAILHAQTAASYIPKLNNSSVLPGYVNPLVQSYKENTGDEAFQGAKTGFISSVNALASEMSKAFGGSKAASEIEHWRQGADVTAPPAAQKAYIQSGMQLLNGALESLGDQYNRGMKSMRDPMDLLAPHNKAVFQGLLGPGIAPADGGAPAVDASGAAAPTAPAAPAKPLLAPGQTTTINGVTIRRIN